MVIYVLKFSACLVLFIVFYKLFLERESFHGFKRVYLLAALAVSIIIPFITLTQYIEAPVLIDTNQIETQISIGEVIVQDSSIMGYLPTILWFIYALGVIVFSIRFIKHLKQLYVRIKTNQKLKNHQFTNVLLKDPINPHTFFKYIFLNKFTFEHDLIPKEVLLHEQTHARQLHALDNVLVELVHIIFWFNPLMHILKKDIKLNHEFLADQSVLNKGAEPSAYQKILLAFSSNAIEPQLANAINYSLIKKRFTVMKTQTSKRSTWIRSLILLPLLAFMVYGFSSRELIEKDNTSETSTEGTITSSNLSSTEHTARSISIEVLKDGSYLVDNINAKRNTLKSIVNTLHQDVSSEVRNRIMNIHVSSSSEISDEELWFIYNSLLDYGFHRIVTDNQKVVRSKGNTPFAIENNDAQKYDDGITKNDKQVSPKEFEKNIVQKGASREQMAEYNKLAKHYNDMSHDNMRVKMSDIKRLKYIYGLMSDKQRKDAEPFPDFPKPPPAPDAAVIADVPPPPPIPDNATVEQKVKYKKATEKYYKERKMKARTLKGEVADMPPPPPIPDDATPEQKVKYKKAAEKYYKEKKMKERTIKGVVADAPPPPPPPKDPVDHAIDMAKLNAVFYLEGKEVSSDKAIDALKKNKSLNIQTIKRHDQPPLVKISIKPIVIKTND